MLVINDYLATSLPGLGAKNVLKIRGKVLKFAAGVILEVVAP